MLAGAGPVRSKNKKTKAHIHTYIYKYINVRGSAKKKKVDGAGLNDETTKGKSSDLYAI